MHRQLHPRRSDAKAEAHEGKENLAFNVGVEKPGSSPRIGGGHRFGSCYLVGLTSEMTRGLDGASSHSIHLSLSSIVSKNRQSLYSSSVVSNISPMDTSSRAA